MTSVGDINAVPFGGALGAEFERVWAAIRSNQIVPTAGQRVSRTTGGSMLSSPRAAGSAAPAPAPRLFRPNGIDRVIAFREWQRLTGSVDADGWIQLPWVAIDLRGSAPHMMLLAPLSTAEIYSGVSTWGIGGAHFNQMNPTREILAPVGSVGAWGGITIPTPGQIGHNVPGKWQAPFQLPLEGYPAMSGTPAHFLAVELETPLPAGQMIRSITSSLSQTIQIPEIHWIQIYANYTWAPQAGAPF